MTTLDPVTGGNGRHRATNRKSNYRDTVRSALNGRMGRRPRSAMGKHGAVRRVAGSGDGCRASNGKHTGGKKGTGKSPRLRSPANSSMGRRPLGTMGKKGFVRPVGGRGDRRRTSRGASRGTRSWARSANVRRQVLPSARHSPNARDSPNARHSPRARHSAIAHHSPIARHSRSQPKKDPAEQPPRRRAASTRVSRKAAAKGHVDNLHH